MNSVFYDGWIRRRRYDSPEYLRVPATAMYLDLAETSELFSKRPLWSAERAAPAWLRRSDYLGDPTLTLDESVRRLAFEKTGRPVEGPVRMLAQLRTWGLARGPADAFYCFDATDSKLEAVVLDLRAVAGIPPQTKVLDTANADYDGERYRWNEPENGLVLYAGKPEKSLMWHVERTGTQGRLLDATVYFDRRPLDARATVKTLLIQPLFSARLCLTL